MGGGELVAPRRARQSSKSALVAHSRVWRPPSYVCVWPIIDFRRVGKCQQSSRARAAECETVGAGILRQGLFGFLVLAVRSEATVHCHLSLGVDCGRLAKKGHLVGFVANPANKGGNLAASGNFGKFI